MIANIDLSERRENGKNGQYAEEQFSHGKILVFD